jgi:hypothetical protein
VLKISGVSRFKRVVWFRKIDADDLVLVGKKAYDLNALYSSGFEVPPSFVITTRAYKDFIKGFEGRLDHYLSRIDINDKQQVREIATKIQKLILSSYMPQMLEQEILDAYDSMNVDIGYSKTLKAFDFLKSGDKGVVAVRTSPVAKEPISVKDMEFISFLNIQGVVQLLRAIKACWASLFSSDNIIYREKNNLSHKDIYAAVIIQKMVKSEKSGMMLTSNPNGNDKEAIIEICWGLGKTLKEVTPDCFFVDKKQNTVLNEETNRQAWGYFGGVQGRIEKQDLPDRLLRASKLEPAEIIKLSNIAKTVEEKYEDPYEIEFTFDKEKMWIIGMKPMIGKKVEKAPEPAPVQKKEEEKELDLDEEAKQMEELLNNIFKSPPIKKPVKREETKVMESAMPEKPEIHPQVTVTQTVEEKEPEPQPAPEPVPEPVEEPVPEPVQEPQPVAQEPEDEYIEIPIPKEEPVEAVEEKETIVEKMTEPELSYEQQQRLIEEIKQKYAPAEEEPEIEYEVATEPELVMPNAAVVAKSKQDIISKLKEIHAPMEETNYPQPEKKVEEESTQEPMQQAEAEPQEQREEVAEQPEEITPNEQVMEEVQREEPIEQSTTPEEEMMADVPQEPEPQEQPAPEPTPEPQQEEVPEELPKPEFTEEPQEQPAPEPAPGPVEEVAEEHREEPAPEPQPEPVEEVAEEPQEQPVEEGMTEFDSRLNLITERYIQTYPHMRSVFNEYKERVKGLYKELH